uniref:Beta-galactosidase n=1 Tax=Cacopsylla melanoneura TaxID=428564 RepID=A0A8D9BQE7_9HEMI
MSYFNVRIPLTRVLVFILLFFCGIIIFYNRELSSSLALTKSRTFTIDLTNETFLMDGKPFRFVSGEFHYFRTPRPRWRDILRKIRAAGLNAVSTYVEWSFHEATPGRYNFVGDKDVEHFMRLAVEEGLYVLLRPGPFICGERDFGGLPPWLFKVKEGIRLRQNDPTYQHYVAKWYRKLFTRLKTFMYGNGGPIIMIQVENEFGMRDHCDPKHAIWLRDLIKSFVHDTAVLYSIDPPHRRMQKCVVDGVYPTVDFGPFQNLTRGFKGQRLVAPRGPLVNAEFYTGWLTHWGEESMQSIPSEEVIDSLEQMLAMGASVNIFMFFGGTNFGFKNGANFDEKYMPTVTSYDYDSPLDESGDPTDKYFQIQDVMRRYMSLPNIAVARSTMKKVYDTVFLTPTVSVFDAQIKQSPVKDNSPLTFEKLGQNYGFVLYETVITENQYCETCTLGVEQIRDRAQVFIDEEFVGSIYRADSTSVDFNVSKNQKLSLFVENMGRINHDKIYDQKGILSMVLLDNEELLGWEMYKFPLDDVSSIELLQPTGNEKYPMFLTGILNMDTKPMDTYLDMRNWTKGVVFVNGNNLGRYWSDAGPQYSLFLPSEFLNVGTNMITIFELERASPNYAVKFSPQSLNKIVYDEE